MYAVEFETINENGLIKIPKEYQFENQEHLRVIILKNDNQYNQKKEVEDLLNDYKKNGMKNFISYEDGNEEIKKWVNGLDENN